MAKNCSAFFTTSFNGSYTKFSSHPFKEAVFSFSFSFFWLPGSFGHNGYSNINQKEKVVLYSRIKVKIPL